MIDKPLYSVLIANYNNGKYLMDAVESVRRQTYTNWEIILVDDGSTDNSHALYKELENDARIHIYLNDKNSGCGFSKHRCAELANGQYCGFLDPDDELLSDALECLVAVHIKNPNVSIVMSRNYICDQHMNVLYTSRLLVLPDGVSYLENNDFEAEAMVSYRNDFYKRSNKLNPRYLAGVDADLNFILEEVGDLFVLDKVTYKYRKHVSTSITANAMKASFFNFMVRQDAYKRRGKEPIDSCLRAYEECVNQVVNRMLYMQQKEIRSSKTYRIGKIILMPLRTIQAIFKHKS